MDKDNKTVVQDFEKMARPVDQVAHIDNREIINLLKEIRRELRLLNKR